MGAGVDLGIWEPKANMGMGPSACWIVTTFGHCPFSSSTVHSTSIINYLCFPAGSTIQVDDGLLSSIVGWPYVTLRKGVACRPGPVFQEQDENPMVPFYFFISSKSDSRAVLRATSNFTLSSPGLASWTALTYGIPFMVLLSLSAASWCAFRSYADHTQMLNHFMCMYVRWTIPWLALTPLHVSGWFSLHHRIPHAFNQWFSSICGSWALKHSAWLACWHPITSISHHSFSFRNILPI